MRQNPLIHALAPFLWASFITPRVTSAATIYARYDDATGVLRITSPARRCKVSETRLTWNDIGPKGPQDDQGPKAYYTCGELYMKK